MSSDDNENKKKLVGVRITESRRKKWKDFVDDSEEYSSMAEVMRTGVRKIIAETRDEEKDDESMKEKLDFIADRQWRLIQNFEDFREENKRLFENIDDAYEIADEVINMQEQMESDGRDK